MRMITKFSSQYYIGELYVAPLHPDATTTVEGGQMNQHDFNELHQEIYGDTLFEAPVFIKIDNRYIGIKPSDSIPSRTVHIPRESLDELGIENPPSHQEVMFPTKEAIEQFNKMGFIN